MECSVGYVILSLSLQENYKNLALLVLQETLKGHP